MANKVDINAARAAWEALEAGRAGLLASQCKSHRPYTGCPMDCGDVANALDPEFETARPLIAAALDEVENLRGDVRELSAILDAMEANDATAVVHRWQRDAAQQEAEKQMLRSELAEAHEALTAARQSGAHALAFVSELAEEDCSYGDNCPSNARHYRCLRCKALAVKDSTNG